MRSIDNNYLYCRCFFVWRNSVMPNLRQIFVISFFIFAFSTIANAQQVPNYLFLEVVDSQNKPVKDATIQIAGNFWENDQSKITWTQDFKTDEKGTGRTYLDLRRSDFYNTLFRVTKPEYFPFYDLGTKITEIYTNTKIELLKIPTTDEERKTLGNEQTKREFMWAVKTGDAETVRNLLKSGINPNLNTNDLRGISSPKNIPAILFAAAAGNGEMVEILLKAKVKVHKKEEPMQSIAAYYIRAFPQKKDQKTISEYENGLRSLIKSGAEIKEFPMFNNANALMLAAASGNISFVKILLEKGLSINAQDKNENTALTGYANIYGDEAMIQFLLESGANPNIVASRDKDNCYSILMQAIYAKKPQLVKTLIKHKADVNFTCKDGKNALKIAEELNAVPPNTIRYGNIPVLEEIIKLLKAAGAK